MLDAPTKSLCYNFGRLPGYLELYRYPPQRPDWQEGRADTPPNRHFKIALKLMLFREGDQFYA
jgi:hypothetical protein